MYSTPIYSVMKCSFLGNVMANGFEAGSLWRMKNHLLPSTVATILNSQSQVMVPDIRRLMESEYFANHSGELRRNMGNLPQKKWKLSWRAFGVRCIGTDKSLALYLLLFMCIIGSRSLSKISECSQECSLRWWEAHKEATRVWSAATWYGWISHFYLPMFTNKKFTAPLNF